MQVRLTKRGKDSSFPRIFGIMYKSLRLPEKEEPEMAVWDKKKVGCGMMLTRRNFVKGAASTLALAGTGALAGGLSGCRSELGDEVFRGTRTITDHAGRELQIPIASELTKIYYTSPLAQIYVFTLDPDKQGGTAMSLNAAQMEYLPDSMADLVSMGSLSYGGEIDREMLIQQGIQLVFSISGVELSASNISDAEDLQEATGIPVVLVDGSFTNINEAYRMVGDIMGCEDRAESIAQYCEQVYSEVTAAVSGIPEDEKVSLYYAEGPLGLSTEPSVSQHAKAFEVAGAYNVADVEESASGFGMSSVSLESVIAWNPEVIIAWDEETRGGAANYIRASSDWSGIKAVKDGRVYAMPNLPFAWCDRPNGVQRFLGIQWLANMLYPDLYNVDMVEETKKFYSKLYWVDITDEQALDILGSSYPPYGTAIE